MKGRDYIKDDVMIKNSELTRDPEFFHSYAFCSDTSFSKEIISRVKNIDVLYHETTFAKDVLERARETGHSTTHQAGQIAKRAKVKLLITGHYSQRYTDLSILLKETKEVFQNSMLSYSGMTFDFNTLYK